ncbi:MAG TPA: glycosyltransferase family 39 protein [Candidatus Methanoperedens sp.]|nr:glycosyltransferase family 39 protein [Candidatus Methanoperedens sp.]
MKLDIKQKIKSHLLLFIIVALAFFFRIYGLNWDQYYHLHPDERQITIVTTNIKFPQNISISEIFSPDSPLNPKFFAYGSFPIYLLKFLGYLFSFIDSDFSSYEKINLLGRLMSAIFDSLTVLLIYLISKQLFFSKKISILASSVYAFSVFPVQLSHFYAVDTLLTFFICLTLYRILLFYRYPSFKNAIIIGLCFGLSLATKISATILIVSFTLCLFVEFLLSLKRDILYQKSSRFKKIISYFLAIFNPKVIAKNKGFRVQKTIFYFLSTAIATFVFFVVFEPFALLDFSTFWRQINEQSLMTKDAFVFPYTLQYVGTLPYLYPLKNIFLWGLGPPFAILSLIGIYLVFKKLLKGLFSPGNELSEGTQLIVYSFFIAYFFVVGQFDVKFMRYCLPIYPILSIFAAYVLSLSSNKIKILFYALNFIWLFSFLNIYRFPNTRVSATKWIQQNVPAGSTILREHWDDGIPLGYNQEYNLQELTLYDTDLDPRKWSRINWQLKNGDYLVLASNRLYTPLQKLTNCQDLPVDKCYLITSKYYQDLFSGKLGYTKVAEFTSYPRFFAIPFIDDQADESFTVYDHPKVIIFKNNSF